MTYLIVLAVVVALAYWKRDKWLPHFRALKTRLSKTPAAPSAPSTGGAGSTPTTYVDPPIPQPDYSKVKEAIQFLKDRGVDPITSFELLRRMGRGLYPHEDLYARGAGVIFRDAPPVGPIDRSGNDLSDGTPRTFVLADGQQQTVTFNRAGTVRVWGYSGTQVDSVTDHETRSLAGTTAWYDRELPAGSYTFSVVSRGGNIAVMLV